METPFERIIISFDEDGFNRELQEIESAAESFNLKISDLANDHEIKLSDREIKKFIVELQDPEPYIKSLYTEFPKHLRELGQSKIREFFSELKQTPNLYNDNVINNIKVLKNKVVPDPERLEILKTKYETSLDTPRAKIAYDLHQSLYDTMIRLMEMGKENGIHTTVMTFFHYDRERNLEMEKIAYNRL